MPRVCTICNHPKRAEIERSVATKIGSIRSIADSFDISRPALIRHLKDHISQKMAGMVAENQIKEIEDLTETIRDQIKRSKKVYDKADKLNDLKVSLMAIREEREGTKILAQMQGELDNPGVTVNITQFMTDEEVKARAREILKQQ